MESDVRQTEMRSSSNWHNVFCEISEAESTQILKRRTVKFRLLEHPKVCVLKTVEGVLLHSVVRVAHSTS